MKIRGYCKHCSYVQVQELVIESYRDATESIIGGFLINFGNLARCFNCKKCIYTALYNKQKEQINYNGGLYRWSLLNTNYNGFNNINPSNKEQFLEFILKIPDLKKGKKNEKIVKNNHM